MNDDKKYKILIVDDDEAFRILLKDILYKEPYLVEEACNGLEALDKMRKLDYDLVVADIIMPEINGMEMLAKIQEEKINVKVIAISGGASLDPDSYLNVAKSLGACVTINKPFGAEKLISLMREILSEDS